MIYSGMPGVSAFGSFVPGLGYTVISTASPGNFSLEFETIQNYQCVLSPKTPIALIISINKFGTAFTPSVFISENDIPQT